MKATLVAFVAATVLGSGVASAASLTLVDNATQGLYNDDIGTLLDGTSGAFPNSGDPLQDFGPGDAPDLSAAAGVLGNWLTNPDAPGGSWSGPQAIPLGWNVWDETAIIYELRGNVADVIASFGVDNGIFVWLDGVFQGGAMRPGGAYPGEFVLNLGDLGAGDHYLQVLREDHGGATGYDVSVTASTVPLPAGGLLLLSALSGVAALRRRKTA
jgi:hypothetical protein